MRGPINPVDHPICLAVPERQAPSCLARTYPVRDVADVRAVGPTPWSSWAPIYGTSYCSFCQAIDALELPTRAFAVDTWGGDPHNGPNTRRGARRPAAAPRSPLLAVLEPAPDDVRRRRALVSRTRRSISFISMDIIHTKPSGTISRPGCRRSAIEGSSCSTTSAERIADFGVWRLWDEVTARYPSFTFVHEHGLGVLAVGPDVPDEVAPCWISAARRSSRSGRSSTRWAVDSGSRAIWRRARPSATRPRRARRAPCRAGRLPRRAGCHPRRAGRHPRRAGSGFAPSGIPPTPSATPPAPSGTPPWPQHEPAATLRPHRVATGIYRTGLEATRADRERVPLRSAGDRRRLASLRREWEERHSSQSYRAFDQVMRLAGRLGAARALVVGWP